MQIGQVYLIPVTLHEDGMQAIPAYVEDAVKQCGVFFVENERSARRFLKKLWKELPIDERSWYSIHKVEEEVLGKFRKELAAGQTIGILSEAGCPGIADPGQLLIAEAQRMKAVIHPLVGPSSLLLAIMASGLNGQRFQFHGYLPIDSSERQRTLQELESYSQRNNCTQLFIETPYRNNQLLENLLRHLRPTTRLCLAVDLTSPGEWIRTQTVGDWKKQIPDLHKRPAIFLLLVD